MRKILLAAIATAAVSLAAPAFAAEVAPEPQAPGVQDLGIDISNAGGSPESVNAFLDQQLTPEGQQSVRMACERILSGQTGSAPRSSETYSFCSNALS